MNIYSTYLTFYSGNKFPPFYIGSSSVKRIKNGYHGSVSSKKYQFIWEQELKSNPNLFKTTIISYHKSKKEAIEKENFFHENLNVVKNPLYINQSKARINGFFGMDVSGKNNPRYGSKWGSNHPKGMKDKSHSIKSKELISLHLKGKKAWNKGIKSPKHSEFMKVFMKNNKNSLGKRYKQKRILCLNCNKEIACGEYKRRHLLKCLNLNQIA